MSEKRTSSEEFKVARSDKGVDREVSFPFAFTQEGIERWTRGMSAFATEMTSFLQARLQSDMEAWTKLAACRSPDEALECHQRFAEQAMTDYLDAFGRLSQLTMGTANVSPSAPQQPRATVSSVKPVKVD